MLNGRTEIPTRKWQTEQKELTAESYSLAENFYRLKDEVKSAEVLRRGMEELMKGEVQREQPQRGKGLSL